MATSNHLGNEPLTYQQVEELLPGFALGALDLAEMEAVERYLKEQEQLIQYRYDLELSAQAVAFSAAPQPLPGSIKQRLMERVRNDITPAEPRRSPFAAKAATPQLPPNLPPPQRRAALPLFPQKRAARSSWWGVAQGLIGVAVLAATALLLYSNLQLQRSTAQLEQQVALYTQEAAANQQILSDNNLKLAAAEATIADSQGRLNTVQAELAITNKEREQLQGANQNLQQTIETQSEQIDMLVTANRFLTLASLGANPNATATFFVNNNSVILNIQGLPPVPGDKTYQLWYLSEGEDPKPADIFQVETGVSTLLTFTLPSQVTAFANVGISIEPAGGSQTPTDVVMVSNA